MGHDCEQGYDKYMMKSWEDEATRQGLPIPCRVGPQTAGDYNSTPGQTQFFQTGAGLTNGICYSETYGKAFLTWYSTNLVDHGKRVLQIADKIFKPSGVTIAAKVRCYGEIGLTTAG
jgi:beta-amylase